MTILIFVAMVVSAVQQVSPDAGQAADLIDRLRADPTNFDVITAVRKLAAVDPVALAALRDAFAKAKETDAQLGPKAFTGSNSSSISLTVSADYSAPFGISNFPPVAMPKGTVIVP